MNGPGGAEVKNSPCAPEVAALPRDLLREVCAWLPDEWRATARHVCRAWAAANRDHTKLSAVVVEGVTLAEWALALGGNLTAIGDEGARRGDHSVLLWAQAHGYEWEASTASAAAGGGHLATLRWLRERGCGWSSDTCRAAAAGGHLEELSWAVAERCYWYSRECFVVAAAGGHLPVLRWLKQRGCQWCSEALRRAAEGGHLAVLEEALTEGAYVPWETICDAAAEHGRLRVLEWAARLGAQAPGL